jgi:hypothetical protein
MIKLFKRLFCNHEWKHIEYICPASLARIEYYECGKCGKQDWKIIKEESE